MELKDLLHSIGYYDLKDDGKYWRTRAIYRDGDNKTSLRINKVTGRFDDFVQRISGNIDDLVKLTTGLGEDADLKDFYEKINVNPEELVNKSGKPRITMEKVWNLEEEMKTLLPHYVFYEKRGIGADVLRFFRSGLSHSGSMSERFVFPIFRHDGQIHGMSGRDVTGRKDAKWKHMGRKAKWLYPVYVPKEEKTTTGTNIIFPCLNAILETKEVHLVESHGDMLALWQRGIHNVVVTFGLVLSPTLGSFLMSLGVEKVFVCLNNDFESDKNRGKEAAIDMFIDLMSYVNFEKIIIALPKANDFGDLDDELFEEWMTRKYKVNQKLVYEEVLEKLRHLYRTKEITKDQVKLGTAIKERYEEIKASEAQPVTN